MKWPGFNIAKTTKLHCKGCKYLYAEGVGYSNDARTATRLSCALNQQGALPTELPLSEPVEPILIALDACDHYASGKYISLDVTGNEGAGLFSDDVAQVEAITRHSRRPREGVPRSWALTNRVRLGVKP